MADREHAHDVSGDTGFNGHAPHHDAGKQTLTSRLGPSARSIARHVLALMREEGRDDRGVAPDAEAAVDVAAGATGEPLPGALRARFESSLGVDLSDVRVHADETSAEAADAVGARAYAVGQDIHFGAGEYDPSSSDGQFLIAHEVAHTVQQRGGAPARQHKLAVSAPGDAAEVEADRAAEAMVVGAPAQISGAAPSLARKLDTDDAAGSGEKAMMAGAGKALAMQVSNANDVGDAKKCLKTLEDNQALVSKGMAMASPHQPNVTQGLQNMMHGKENKLVMQVPLEAYAHNAALISDIQLYIVEAGGQDQVTHSFQDQYKVLLASFGRLDGIATSFGLSSFKDMKTADAEHRVSEVAGMAGAGGHPAADLSKTFDDLVKNVPEVRGARENVLSSTQALEAMSKRMGDDSTSATTALQAFGINVVNATVASRGANSLKLRQAFEAAKAKATEAKRYSDAAKDVVTSAGGDAAKEALKGIAAGGVAGLSQWGALAATAGASGGTAAAMKVAETLVIEPAKKAIGLALRNADAAVGVIDKEAQLDANLDAEKAKQDSATIEAFKTAKAALARSAEAAEKAVGTWVRTAMEYEAKKKAVTAAFTALSDAIKTHAGARGKGSQGKALAEMTGFLHESEQFVVQSNTVIDMAQKGCGVGVTDGKPTIPGKARTALRNLRNRNAWMVHSYPFRKAGGETVTYYGAQLVNLSVVGPGLDASEAELAGKGRADGAHLDAAQNGQSVNVAIPEAVASVVKMKDRILAVRNQIVSQVFGGGGAAK
jgi:hypothetical protein